MSNDIKIPIWEKVTINIDETCAYSGIGEKTIRAALREPACPFVFYVGNKILIKRKAFEDYISKHSAFK